VPLDFYGKVMDEGSNAIAGATVGFAWNKDSTNPFVNAGEKTLITQSDPEGLFSLQGERGRFLNIRLSKDGYYTPRPGVWSFKYSAETRFSPDSPVVFVLRKKGKAEPLIHITGTGFSAMRDFSLAEDGRPTEVSLRTGQQVAPGQGDLTVEFRAGVPVPEHPSTITWQCRVSIPGGGLVTTDEEYPFKAPEAGYLEFDEWSVGVTNWSGKINRQYYVRLRDGSFGRVNLRVIGVPREAYFRMESFLNPSGPRTLEYDPNKTMLAE